jgi:hypothetical protein
MACESGKWAPNIPVYTVCSDCDGGKYIQSEDFYCTSCLAGRYAINGSASCLFCPAGSYSGNEATACQLCNNGTYSMAGNGTCTNCTSGRYAALQGTANQCDMCAAGSYSGVGATQCMICDQGKYLSSQSSTCSSCQAGKYSLANATTCGSCGSGKYTSLNGSSACSICSNDTYSYGGASTCSTCAQGQSPNGTGCTSCPPSTYSSMGTSCELCSSGYYSNGYGSIVCVICDAGSSTNGSTTCTPCSIGSYSSLTGSTQCSVCDNSLGYYQLSTGQTACLQCDSFMYYNGSICVDEISTVIDTATTSSMITDTTATVYWAPINAASSFYYAVQLTPSSSSSAWSLTSTMNRNFTFFGLTPSTTYSLILLTMKLGSIMGAGGSSRTRYTFTTLPTSPTIISFVAAPNSAGIFGVGATLTITFDKATNEPSGSGSGSLACTFSNELSSTYTGLWTSSTTYVLTVTVVTGSAPSIGLLDTTFESIRTSNLLSLSSSVTSPPLSGTWYARHQTLPYLSVSRASTTLTQSVAQVTLPVTVTLPNPPTKQLYRTVVTISEGSGILSFADTLSSEALTGTALLSSSNTTATITATCYALGRLLAYLQITPSSFYVGRMTVLTTLSSTIFDSATNTTVTSTTICTAVNYYTIVRVNAAPSIATGISSTASIVVDKWTSISSIFGGISLIDTDAVSSSSPLRLQALPSSRAWLSTSNDPDNDINGTSRWRTYDIVGTLSQLQSWITLLKIKTSLRNDIATDTSDCIHIILDDLGNGAATTALQGPQSSLVAIKVLALNIKCMNASSPVIISAQLEGGLSTIRVTFDNVLAIGPTLLCSIYISSITLSLLGQSPICVMTSGDIMTIALGSQSTIIVGQSMTFNAAFVRGPLATNTNEITTITLGASREALTVKPVISFKTPSTTTIPNNTALWLQASSRLLGGRAGTWVWYFNGVVAPSLYVSSSYASSSDLIVPASVVTIYGSYNVSVTVTNFMGQSSTQSLSWYAGGAIPNLRSVGPLTRIVAHNVELNLRVITNQGGASGDALQPCTWTGYSHGNTTTNSVGYSLGYLGSGTSLSLQTSTLNASTSYTFKVACPSSYDNSGLFSSYMAYSVTIASRSLPIAWIDGGQQRTFCSRSGSSSLLSTIILDGSMSKDHDPIITTGSQTASLTYQWKCRTLDNFECLTATSPTLSAIIMPSSSTLTMASSVFLSGHYIFTLTVQTVDGRISTTSREVTITIIPCYIGVTPVASLHFASPDKITPLWLAPASSIAVSPAATIKLTGKYSMSERH